MEKRFRWTSPVVGALRNAASKRTANQIAKNMGLTETAVRKAAQRYGIRFAKSGPEHHNTRFTEGQRDQVADLSKKGLTYRAIQTTLAIPLATVHAICRKKGIR